MKNATPESGFNQIVTIATDRKLNEEQQLALIIELLVRGAELFRPWKKKMPIEVDYYNSLDNKPPNKNKGDKESLLEVLVWKGAFCSLAIFSFLRPLLGDCLLKEHIESSICSMMKISGDCDLNKNRKAALHNMEKSLNTLVNINTPQTYYLWIRYVRELIAPFRDRIECFLLCLNREKAIITEKSKDGRVITSFLAKTFPSLCVKLLLKFLLPYLRSGTLYQPKITIRAEEKEESYPASSRVLFHESFVGTLNTKELDTTLRADHWENGKCVEYPLWACTHIEGRPITEKSRAQAS